MFGADTTNNQTQTTTTITSSDPANTAPNSDSPIISNSTPPIGLGEVSAPDLVMPESSTEQENVPDIPAFIPPDDDGHISQVVEAAPQPTDSLADIKKEALTKLGPLVDKLEQEPVEKFKTLMMMIQASDDQSLIAKAYEAADAISDESEKARALLDIVNEINYFTNQSTESTPSTV